MKTYEGQNLKIDENSNVCQLGIEKKEEIIQK